MEDMTSRNIAVEIKSVAEAPKYGEDTELLKITKVIIVKKGMDSGKPSVDIQCRDTQGNKYLIFTTGAILESVASAISGAQDQ